MSDNAPHQSTADAAPSAPPSDAPTDQTAAPVSTPAPAPAPAPAAMQSAPAATAAAAAQPDAPDGAAGMFSAWGFDVKAVTDNMGIGNLFAAPDAVDPDGVEVGETGAPVVLPTADAAAARGADGAPGTGDETADELGAKAAHLASAATAELGMASKAAQETIGKAAEEIGRGWGNLNSFLDDMLAPDKARAAAAASAADPAPDGADVHAKFRQLFPDHPADDEVVDHYRCVLLQKYRCYLNHATPEQTFALRGRLFVTTAMIAMYVADDGGAFGGQTFGVSIPFQEVAKIQKGAKAMLRVVTKAQTSFIFADFESDTHYSGALSLLEHMTGASAPPPAQTQDAAPELDSQPVPAAAGGETAAAD